MYGTVQIPYITQNPMDFPFDNPPSLYSLSLNTWFKNQGTKVKILQASFN